MAFWLWATSLVAISLVWECLSPKEFRLVLFCQLVNSQAFASYADCLPTLQDGKKHTNKRPTYCPLQLPVLQNQQIVASLPPRSKSP